MIPHTLHIKNFLSYGSEVQTIDFTPYHLIYLSGKNGHGKSALLDAMTWALWGHARKVTAAVKPDQGLLRTGATQMIVAFDFELDKQMYRVKREFVQAQAKQLAYLEFGMMNKDGTIISLTDKTIRATQAVIERTIRLDYASFINSAFLRQGQANEFSQKSPKDRKEILSIILGLQEFDHLKRKSLERAKELITRRQTLGTVYDTLAAQVSNTQEIEQQMQQIQVLINQVKEEEKTVNQQTKHHDEESVLYATQQKEYEFIQFKQAQIEHSYKEHLSTVHGLWKQWRVTNARQRELPDYTVFEEQKKILSQKIQGYQQAAQKRLFLQENIIKLKGDLQSRRQELEIRYAQVTQSMIVALERMNLEKEIVEKNSKATLLLQKEYQAHQMAYKKELEAHHKKEVNKTQLEKEIAQFEKRKNSYQQFIAKVNWLKTEYENLEQKKNIAHENDPSCPLCEQNLTAARRKFLGVRFAKQEQLIMHQLQRLQSIIIRLKLILIEQHKYLEECKQVHTKSEAITKELAGVQEKLIENEKLYALLRAQEEAVGRTIEQKKIELTLHQAKTYTLVLSDMIYKEKNEKLQEIEKECITIAYDEKEHRLLEQQRDGVERKLIDFMELNRAILHQAQRYEEIKKLVITLKQQKRELQEKSELQKKKDVLAKEKQRLEQNTKALQEQIKVIQEKKEKIREEHGRIKTKQEQAERIEKERKKHQEQIALLTGEIEDYQAIAAAAGKDGIQAILIEEAVPEIEQEANYLLAKLTNNQAHIFIESLRDLKSGGSKETLDINISDAAGIRPYEMFSGGEAFRIDFALRIAISKLLARRAGTSLQTLMIDEGFGSQDEEGLSFIMDAIYKIQDDFEKVIVVSHLPSMRDQFPVHFMVEKGPSGSKISVVEQG